MLCRAQSTSPSDGRHCCIGIFRPCSPKRKRLSCIATQAEQRLIVMRAVIALIVIVYLVGVGVVLSPTVQAEWNSGFGVKPRREHRTGPAQRTRVARRDLPQHDRPRLTASDRSGGCRVLVARRQRDKASCGIPRPKSKVFRANPVQMASAGAQSSLHAKAHSLIPRRRVQFQRFGHYRAYRASW